MIDPYTVVHVAFDAAIIVEEGAVFDRISIFVAAAIVLVVERSGAEAVAAIARCILVLEDSCQRLFLVISLFVGLSLTMDHGQVSSVAINRSFSSILTTITDPSPHTWRLILVGVVVVGVGVVVFVFFTLLIIVII